MIGATARKRRQIMGRRPMKTILVPTEQTSAMESALNCALLLAEKFGGRVEGFALRPAGAEMVAMDPDAGMTMVAVKENDADMVRQAEELARTFMQRRGIAQQSSEAPSQGWNGTTTAASTPDTAVTWCWHADAPRGHDFVGSYGRVFHLIVLGRPGEEWQSP